MTTDEQIEKLTRLLLTELSRSPSWAEVFPGVAPKDGAPTTAPALEKALEAHVTEWVERNVAVAATPAAVYDLLLEMLPFAWHQRCSFDALMGIITLELSPACEVRVFHVGGVNTWVMRFQFGHVNPLGLGRSPRTDEVAQRILDYLGWPYFGQEFAGYRLTWSEENLAATPGEGHSHGV